ncbi:hypothetical protein DPX16_3290 [Anabarilius grahami]|uniref:Integrase core domain-containing protein n=1 Tax=Anabarilius grahami TaxID=495550 RepID=A0A3N0XPV2_ANAGA|nr:hypothetical protein DPX16_3290 [Anabarilius grahami]
MNAVREQPFIMQPTASAHISPATRPTRHINTGSKLAEWSLTLKKKVVIIGDSNVAQLPVYNCPELQIDSFPGAKLQHAADLIENSVEPEKIILSFGFNNCQQRYRIAAITELQKARRAAKSCPERKSNLNVFHEGWDNHLLRTEQNLSPNQLWEVGQMEHPIANPELIRSELPQLFDERVEKGARETDDKVRFSDWTISPSICWRKGLTSVIVPPIAGYGAADEQLNFNGGSSKNGLLGWGEEARSRRTVLSFERPV